MLHFDGWFGKGNNLSPALVVLMGLPLYSQQQGLSLRRSCILRAILCKKNVEANFYVSHASASNLLVESEVALVIPDVYFSVNKHLHSIFHTPIEFLCCQIAYKKFELCNLLG